MIRSRCQESSRVQISTFLAVHVAEHLAAVVDQAVVAQVRGQVAQRAADVAGDQLHQLPRRLRVALHLKLLAQEDHRHVGVVQEVLHVVGRARKILHLGLQLGVHGGKLFVERLHFLLGGFQFLVGALQLFVRRLELFVRALEFLVGGFQLLDCGLQRLLDVTQFLFEFINAARDDLLLLAFLDRPA